MFVSAVSRLTKIPGRPGLDGWGQSSDRTLNVPEKQGNTRAAHVLSRFRAHLKHPEERKGKRLHAGKT